MCLTSLEAIKHISILHQTNNLNKIIINIVKGFLIGIANIIPGLSGATLALILGVYKKSIDIITKFDSTLLVLLKKQEFHKAQQYISLSFLISITTGIIISFILMSSLLNLLLLNYPLYTWSYFFGIILASIPYVAKQASIWRRQELSFFLVGFLLSISLLFIEPNTENNNLLFIFICGIIGGIGMLIPGLSGSYLLVILGNYKLLLVETIQKISIGFLHFDSTKNYITELLTYWKIFIVFLLGQTLCIILFSRVIKFLISSYKNATFSILSGFITGSLVYIWPWQNNQNYKTENNKLIDYLSMPNFEDYNDLYAILIILSGVLTIVVIEKMSKKNNNV